MPQSSRPLVSVIIPIYNGEAFLREAIESIHQQNYTPLEIIAVDDGSTDGSADIAKDFQDVRYVYQENQGPAAARNAGLRLAQGEIIGFLDQDDLWPPDKLLIQLPPLIEDPSLKVVFGHTQILTATDNTEEETTFRKRARPWPTWLVSGALFRKSAFDEVGVFDEKIVYYGDDLDWFLRAREAGVSILVSERVTLYYRLHGANTSLAPEVKAHSFPEAIKNSLDRRRQDKDSSIAAVLDFSDFRAAADKRRSDRLVEILEKTTRTK